MNLRSSNWTGRAHRSIESAFGPYARGPIHEPETPMPTADKIVIVASIVAAVAILGFALAGWL